MGTQKNRLYKTVLLSTKNIYLNLLVRKYSQFYTKNFVYLDLWSKVTNVIHTWVKVQNFQNPELSKFKL